MVQNMAVAQKQPVRDFLLDLFNIAIKSVQAKMVLPAHLPLEPPIGKTLVLGAGKAAAAMAAAAQNTLDYPLTGLVITPAGHDCPLPDTRIKMLTAAHPIPDDRSVLAARTFLDMAGHCDPDDRLIFLGSGGGSSLLSLPVPGLSAIQKQEIIRHLLLSGASITQINMVRKHLSTVKGGRLTAACGTRDIHTFLISDVPGNDPAMIASGPTIADETTLSDAQNIIAKYKTPHQKVVEAILQNKANETPKPGTLAGQYTIIARAQDALEAATKLARKTGWQVECLGDRVEGEAFQIGKQHARLALDLKARNGRWLLLSGGELTVKVKNKNGAGGPNLEYLAGLALALNGEPGISALACDTDGIDGSKKNAGGFIGPDTLQSGVESGLNLRQHLKTNQTYRFFENLNDLIFTGPTLTNVNDFRAIAIES